MKAPYTWKQSSRMISIVVATPYIVLLLFALFDFPSKVLAKRYSRLKDETKAFASRWSAAADAITLPIVSLTFAGSKVLTTYLKGTVVPDNFVVATLLILAAILALIAGSLLVLASDITQVGQDSKPGRLPPSGHNSEPRRSPLLYFLQGTKILGILCSYGIEVTLSPE